MRVGLGLVLVACVFAGTWLSSGTWMQQADMGLRQLVSGTIGGTGLRVDADRMHADWRDPHGGKTEPSIAMSESDWLKLADDMAPVSYLPAPVVPQAPVQNEQQPL